MFFVTAVLTQTKTQTDTALEIAGNVQNFSVTSGPTFLLIIVGTILLVLLVFFYGLFRILPLLMILILGVAMVVSLGTLQQRKATVSKAGQEFSPKRIKISTLDEQSVVLTWKTSAPTISAVNYGTNPQELEFTAFPGERGRVKQHLVILDGLETDKRYFYAIISNGKTYTDPGYFFDFPLD